ncbi:hypothetical protein A5821_000966 [Enterococcus sp. 7F3_DIV0205]|uniref:DUF218 domain-containing protein n=1 Tax=Candidatus Enterococcus palustris TaxID=1834189 RepID=A0AAQ3W869_9ENTE|nr:ElyC/SanA/YdcF family protein [Enterococcus sp. 7F3_DIV0205]OTN85363.1 hypothetical protein A5821_001309 [Enterococcus sp. 7F3_DIV0205]
MIQEWNTVIDYLSEKEKVTGTYDLAILAGNSLPYLANELIDLYKQKKVSACLLVGGIGHATPFLRKNFKDMGINVSDTSETEMYLEYFKEKYSLDTSSFLTETTSTNSGENALFSLNTVKSMGITPKKVLLLEDPILQRRIKATFKKEWQETDTVFTNYVPIVPYVTAINETISFEDPKLNGLWSKEYFLSLVLGEIPRLRNDEYGYGPKGRDYIGEVMIPQDVSLAYDMLLQRFEYKQKR